MRQNAEELMRIGIIGQKRVPSREGGVEKTVEQIGIRLADRGYEVILYNRSGHNIYGPEFDLPSVEKYRKMAIKSVFCPRGGFGTFFYSFVATAEAVLNRCRVIIFNGSGSCNMIPLARIAGVKTIAFIHGIDSQRAKWSNTAKVILRRGEKTAAKGADTCLVLSQKDMQYLRDLGCESVLPITNGADVHYEGGCTDVLSRLGLAERGYILSVNRLVPEKRIELLIDAFRSVDTDTKLVIVGGEEPGGADYYHELQKTAAGDNRIQFTGFIDSDAELDDLYLKCRCFVLPSDIEGMSNSLLEALSRGCLCIVSDIGENASVVSEYGMCFKRGDKEDLAQKLKEALASERRLADAQQQIEYVMSNYSWDKATDRIESEIKRLTNVR